MAKKRRVIFWFSCGAASAIAAWLALGQFNADEYEIVIAYCETGAEHEDSERFLVDCERLLFANYCNTVTRLRNEKYADTWDLWTKRRFLAGVNGAICTNELKVVPRMNFQRPSDIHVFGYTADKADIKRANDFRERWDLMDVRTPLIDAGLTKENVLEMILRRGIDLPVMYLLGFHNNNCIPCVKATSPNYWARIRKFFPLLFARMVALSRELNVRLTRINDERIFIDEIPGDWPLGDPIQPACDFMCPIAEGYRLPQTEGDA